MKIVGVDIPDSARVEWGLTKIFGIGPKNVHQVLSLAKVSPNKRVHQLTEEEVSRLVKALAHFKIEGDLRKEIQDNIKRLKAIGCYRGIRHSLNLPVRGQRTRTNARTKRGKRKTVGALTKEAWAKLDALQQRKQKQGGQ